MILINKLPPSQELASMLNSAENDIVWKNIPKENTAALRAYFDHFQKEELRNSTLEEQGYICVYCMKRINNTSCVLEHWTPLSRDKNLVFNYSNILVACDGGRQISTESKRILCCDASKGSDPIDIDPQNINHMKGIAYLPTGKIYDSTNRFQDDLDLRLQLNGLLDKNKETKADTSTQIVKGRRDAYAQYKSIIKKLQRNNRFTIDGLQNEIDRLKNANPKQEYVGVIVFFLERKLRIIQNSIKSQ